MPKAAVLVECGLLRVDVTARMPWFFTEAGIIMLRALMADARLANPAKFAHVRQELGIDPASGHRLADA